MKPIKFRSTRHTSLLCFLFNTTLQLYSREAAAVKVEHSIPALRIPIGTKLRITTSVVVKPIHPTFGVPKNQFFRSWWLAGFMTGSPSLSCFPTIICHTQPALLHSFFLSKNPVIALRNAVTNADAVFQGTHSKFVSINAIVNEASCGSSVSCNVGEKGFSSIPNDCVLLHASRPTRISKSNSSNRGDQK